MTDLNEYVLGEHGTPAGIAENVSRSTRAHCYAGAALLYNSRVDTAAYHVIAMYLKVETT